MAVRDTYAGGRVGRTISPSGATDAAGPVVIDYDAYGIRIASDLALPFPLAGVSSSGLARASLRLIDFEPPSQTVEDGPLKYHLAEDGLWYFGWAGEATYRLGPEGIAVSRDGGSDEAVAARVSGQLLGLWLRREGRLVLHANVVARSDEALALMGATGAGKTTITSALLDRGFSFVSDDLCVLERRGGAWWAQPGPGRLKVRTPTVGDFKSRKEVAPALEASKLRAVYVLHPGLPVQPEPLKGGDAILALVRHAHMPRSLDITRLAAQHFAASGQLARDVSVARLSRGITLEDVPSVVAAVGNPPC
jgi:hypothetical protein